MSFKTDWFVTVQCVQIYPFLQIFVVLLTANKQCLQFTYTHFALFSHECNQSVGVLFHKPTNFSHASAMYIHDQNPYTEVSLELYVYYAEVLVFIPILGLEPSNF